MKEIVWDDLLSVGVDEIDDDHHKLVNLFNILNHSVAEGDDQEYLEAVLEELINCTVWHFSHEERLMLKYGYGGFVEHKAVHKELIKSARALQQKIIEQGNLVPSKDIEFLEHWLTEHILTADMKMGDYLAMQM